MKPKILVTGGPVSTPFDAVKIITNRFKGGLMRTLANDLAAQCEVTYLVESGCVAEVSGKILEHSGLQDYREKVLQEAPLMDAVVLGAAVANLQPREPWTGKFPSHKYGPDDVIPIDFVLTPRIINEVKERAPSTHVFGFKLLANADYEELISAAYEIVLSGHCTAVFANDRSDLTRVCAVTKERAIHPMRRGDIADWIIKMIQDKFYRTRFHSPPVGNFDNIHKLGTLLLRFADRFRHVEKGFIFGTGAIRMPDGRFITTSRGKKEMSTFVVVDDVNHDLREVHVHGEKKATLNAPLLDYIFKSNKYVHSIVHYHDQVSGLHTHEYAPPGTVRDSIRHLLCTKSFNIDKHGCFLLLDEDGNQL